ncbi:MAG TPA: ATP-binding protein [Puia sp.]|nr:ATP-binding protein [Puia sp.]
MAFLFTVISVLFLSVTPSLGQQPEASNGYFVQHFTDENGLPQNSINDLLFDDNGYLWLGSQVGLICWNGYSFKLFYPNDKPIMESNVLLLGKSGNGHIYFQTDDKNLYCYPGNNSHRLRPLNTAVQKDPRLLNTHKQVFDFTHFLKVGSSSESRRLIFQYLFDHNDSFYPLDSVSTYLIYHDSLYYYDGDSLEELTRAAGNSFLLSGRKLYQLKKGDITAVYEGSKKLAGGNTIGGDLPKDLAQAGKKSPGYRFFSSGNIHHLLAGNRLYRLYPGNDGVLKSRFLLDLGFITNITTVEYNEALDLLLVATETEGFYYLHRSPFQVNGFSPILKKELGGYLFGPLALYRDSAILTTHFGFDATGAYRLSKDSGNIWHRCIYVSRKKEIWDAAYNFPRLLTADMRVIKVFPALDAPVVDYREDEQGDLYCLTEHSLWRLQGDSFRLLFSGRQLPLKGNNESFCLVGPHRWWIGNVSGLMEYDPDKGALTAITALAGAHVRSIHLCRDSSVLIGTYGQGYFYYRRGRFRQMPMDRNEFLITAHCFLEDKEDNIWIPCNKGLFKVPRADIDAWFDSTSSRLYYYYYGRRDGLLTNEFNGGFNASGVLTTNGFAALLSMKGMVCFHTDSLSSEFPGGRVDMAAIDIDGNAWDRTDSIKLPADYNSLLVTLSCPFLGERNNLHLEYTIRGLDEQWKEVPEDGVLNLSRLGPGHYTLSVRKVNGFGKDNYSYREWPLVVAPHFYQAAWFWLLVGLTLLVLVIAVIQLSVKLGEKGKEVKAKAEESQQALMQSGNLRQKLISLVIHDLLSPLRFLTMLAGDLYDNHDHYSEAELKERMYWIKKGSQDVYNFSEDFLLWVTSQRDNFSISRRLIQLRPLLQEIYDFFLEQVQQKGNSLSCEAAEDLQTHSDPHILITIIRNLVDNANKYTDGGEIVVRAYEEGACLLITVSDTGRGMSARQVESFQTGLENVNSGSQLGHKFISDLTHRLNGKVSIQSKEEVGTTVTLSFPKE